MTEILYKETTFDIRGACFWVWKEFRGAFKEKVVDRALTIELKKRNRVVEDQKRLNIKYEGIKVGTYIPDKIIDGKVLVEVKCKEFLTQQDIDQFWKYLKGSDYKVGMLINFGPKELEIKRVVYDTARAVRDPRLDPRQRSVLRSAEKGFTLMEIIVATTIFAMATAALMSLFNYTLKINRRSEALRQASQGMRNFVEFLVKEIRNGQVNYLVLNGSSQAPAIGAACTPPSVVSGVDRTYQEQDNKLAIITDEGAEECIYLGLGPGHDAAGKSVGDYVGAGVFSSNTTVPGSLNPSPVLVLQKRGIPAQVITPSNFRIENLMFLVRPICDPFAVSCNDYSGGTYPEIQPAVAIIMKFVVKLPTGEQVPIYYQTSVSSNKYDIPHN